MRIIVYIILFLLSSLFFSCQKENEYEVNKEKFVTNVKTPRFTPKIPEKVTVNEYIDWVSSYSGFNDFKSIAGINYALSYRPAEAIAIQKLKNGKITKESIEKISNELEGVNYFVLRLSTNDGCPVLEKNLSVKEEYFQRIQYYSFLMENDVFLIDGADTIKCCFYNFERDYEVSPFLTVTLGFDDIAKSDNYQFVLIDKVFNNGKVIFSIDRKLQKAKPIINLE